MKTELNTEHIRWEMDWTQTKPDGTRLYPDKPDKETVFDEEAALAMLLACEVVFLNTHWWKADPKFTKEDLWSESAANTFSINVQCNDVFAWASADAEEMFHEDIESVYTHWEKDPYWGPAVWCIKKRNLMPQKPVYEAIMKAGIWNLDTMGLQPNN
jgi:hypothetical protein